MPAAAPVSKSPVTPAAAPVSPEAVARFQDLKRGLGELASWELSGNGYQVLAMAFSEGGNEQQARTLAAILQ